MISNGVQFKGKFQLEHIRNGEVIGRHECPNGIVNVGLNQILDVQFASGTQVTSWFMGLVDNSGFTAFAAADTMSSHAGWSENTNYDAPPRAAWGAGAAASQQVTNGTAAEFTINAGVAIKGMFITTNSTKGGTTGTLWSTAAFTSVINAVASDTIRVTYTVTAS